MSNSFFDFGHPGDIHFESKKSEEPALKCISRSHQPGDVCADLFAFCQFSER
jgi:hypothetical protein